MISCHRVIEIRSAPATLWAHLTLGPREVQDVLDEMHQAPAFLHDHTGRRVSLVVRSHAPEIQRLGEEKDL